MRDAEVAEVGDERAGAGEPEAGGQLEPVGRAKLRGELAHVARLRITIDRDMTST